MTASRLMSVGTALACLIAAVVLAGTLSQGHSQRGRGPREGSLKVGDPAPDFTLKTLDETAEVTLSNYQGECPVALIFGSYT